MDYGDTLITRLDSIIKQYEDTCWSSEELKELEKKVKDKFDRSGVDSYMLKCKDLLLKDEEVHRSELEQYLDRIEYSKDVFIENLRKECDFKNISKEGQDLVDFYSNLYDQCYEIVKSFKEKELALYLKEKHHSKMVKVYISEHLLKILIESYKELLLKNPQLKEYLIIEDAEK